MTARRTTADTPDVRARYRTALDGLFQRRRFGMAPGLEVEQAILASLGHPERRFPAIHVTGSKGKGSVATLAASLLSGQGLSTALYTSPHLASYRERMRIDGRLPRRAEIVDGLARVEGAAKALLDTGAIDRSPTFFEVTTALAFDWFARAGVDAAVVEVGLGGRLDATNVLDSRVGVLTTVELEHTAILGPTVEAIAGEKSGILHPGMRGIVGELPKGAMTVVERTADAAGVPLWRLGREVRTSDRSLSASGQSFTVTLPHRTLADLSLPLFGTFQVGNTALALAAVDRFLESIDRPFREESARRALAEVRVPGRMERRERAPELFFDVAHTPESARAVAASVGEVAPLADPSQSAVVFGCLADKDAEALLDALAPLARTVVLVAVRSERAMSTGAMRVAAAARFPRVVVAPDARSALAVARAATTEDGITLVTGSDYLIGELVRGDDASDEPDLTDPGVSSLRSPSADVGARGGR